MRKDIGTIIFGMLFLAAGIAVGGSMLGYFSFNINFAGWWTLFIIVPAVLTIIQGGFNTGNTIMLGVGIILLMDAQQILPNNFSWRLIIPAILLIIGVQLIFSGRNKRYEWNGSEWKKTRTAKRHSCSTDTSSSSGEGSDTAGEYSRAHEQKTGKSGGIFSESSRPGNSYKTASVLFAGQDIRYGNEEFTGASYTAIFGGLNIDMRNVQLTSDVIITVTAMFGGIEITLPDNVQVVSHVTPILGGSECKYPSSRDPEAPCVIIKGTASFGGIEIK